MALNAKELGLDATINELRRLLVQRFQVANTPEAIRPDEPLFSAGVGLSSLDGIELLTEIEKLFAVPIVDFEHWIDESPTVASFAQYLIDNTKSDGKPQ